MSNNHNIARIIAAAAVAQCTSRISNHFEKSPFSGPNNNMLVCVICKIKNSPFRKHQFPFEPNLRKLWLDKCGLQENQISRYSKICSVHFNANCYKGTKKRVLKSNAYPTRFPKQKVFTPPVTIEKYETKFSDSNFKLYHCTLCNKYVERKRYVWKHLTCCEGMNAPTFQTRYLKLENEAEEKLTKKRGIETKKIQIALKKINIKKH